MPHPAPLAFSYLRFSSDNQADGDSVRRQTSLRDGWLARSGAVLDTSVTLQDSGVSGFKGAHRKNPERNALAAFLRLVEQGRIPRGSWLVVEALDRLTREDIQPALMLFLGLLQAGIRIVQLAPSEVVYDDKSETMQIMLAIVELSRGNSESRIKSVRLAEKWAMKKKAAAEKQTPLRGPCPAWLRVVDGRYELVPERAAVVRRIFGMAAAGEGVRSITATLTREGVPPIGANLKPPAKARKLKRRPTGSAWNTSYVRKLLNSPAVVGTYQPMKGTARRGGTREPDGPPVVGFYPAAVTQRQFDAAQGAKKRRPGGRPAKASEYLFTGLLRDARDGSTLYQQTFRYAGRTYPAIVYPVGDEGAQHSFPLDVFEEAVLRKLREIDPREILPDEPPGGDVDALEGAHGRAVAKLEKLKARVRNEDESEDVLDLVREQGQEVKRLAAEAAAARQAAASPLDAAWEEYGNLYDALKAAPDERAARAKLRAVLRRIVTGVWCVFARPGGRPGPKVAVVQFWFEGGRHRDWWIVYTPAHGSETSRQPADSWCDDYASPGRRGDIDLRDRRYAENVEKELASRLEMALATKGSCGPAAG